MCQANYILLLPLPRSSQVVLTAGYGSSKNICLFFPCNWLQLILISWARWARNWSKVGSLSPLSSSLLSSSSSPPPLVKEYRPILHQWLNPTDWLNGGDISDQETYMTRLGDVNWFTYLQHYCICPEWTNCQDMCQEGVIVQMGQIVRISFRDWTYQKKMQLGWVTKTVHNQNEITRPALLVKIPQF